MKNRLFSFLLMLAILFTLAPVAYAANDLTAGGTIVLTRDVTIGYISINKDTVLDLNGHTVTGSKSPTETSSLTSIVVEEGVSLTIRNGTLKSIFLQNYGTILSMQDVTLRGSIHNYAYGTVQEIRRCFISNDTFPFWNDGHIQLIDNCKVIARDNFSAIRNDGTIELIRRCYLQGAQSTTFGMGLVCHSGSSSVVEDSILVGRGHGGILYDGGTLSAEGCVIVNTFDTLGEGSLAISMHFPDETPDPKLRNCTLIASVGACGSVEYDENGEWYYEEHADMRNCEFLILSEVDLDYHLDWTMEEKPAEPADPPSPEPPSLDHFAPVNEYAEGQFADVAGDYWGAPNIARAYELGLMKGSSDTAFDPENSVTVAQAITMAARLHSIYSTGTENFVQSGVWYQVYVDYCKEKGILTRDFDDYNAPATRRDFAAILAAALPAEALPAINTVSAIPDVAEDSEFADAIYALYRAGILTGNDAAGTFGPETSISRAAAAAILTRMADPALRRSITL